MAVVIENLGQMVDAVRSKGKHSGSQGWFGEVNLRNRDSVLTP